MSKVQVSIVLPAYNEEKYIENTLFSLLKSEQQTSINYEVILVDNNSADKTVERALKFKKGMDLKIITETKQGRGAARARGFEEAKGEIILSADSDTIFYKGWIETLANSIKGEVVAVSTSCKVVDASAFTNTIFSFLLPIFMVSYRIFFGHFWLSGFSFGVLKSVYIKSGGFDTSLQAQEDTDLSFRVAKLGKIEFINKPVTVSGRRFKEGLAKELYKYIQTFLQANLFKDKQVYLDNPR